MNYVLINGILLDGTEHMEPRMGLAVFVNGETIEAIRPMEGKAPQGYQVIDLQGKYLMPGLINMHVHLPSSGKPKKKAGNPAKLVKFITSNAFTRKLAYEICASMVKTQVLSGVTTLRTIGGILDIDTRIRDDVLAGKLQGPRLLAANTAVSVEGGHMTGSVAMPAKDIPEAIAMVDRLAEEKVDLIKLMITGGVLDPLVVISHKCTRMKRGQLR